MSMNRWAHPRAWQQQQQALRLRCGQVGRRGAVSGRGADWGAASYVGDV